MTFLRQFALVFFEDILIYITSWLAHLRVVLDVLRRHKLFFKRIKFSFSKTTMSYLGHIISAAGGTMGNKKVQAVMDWSPPHRLAPCVDFSALSSTTVSLSRRTVPSQHPSLNS